jgi:hypothetical protein
MSLLETLVSTALTLALTATILSLVTAGQAIARAQPEAFDIEQRARVAMRTLAQAVRDAGAGIERGPLAGPLVRHFPPIVPSSGGGVTIWTTTNRAAQGAPSVIVEEGATTIPLQESLDCPSGQAGCAFRPDTTAIAFTAAGCRTTVRIASVTADALDLAAPLQGCILDPSSVLAEGEVRTYWLDTAARTVMRRDEATGSTSPVLDGVSGFGAAYFADAAAEQPLTTGTDADMMRVRLVRLTLRLSAIDARLKVADLAVTLDVVPPNLEDR